jgi:hypothetical protein
MKKQKGASSDDESSVYMDISSEKSSTDSKCFVTGIMFNPELSPFASYKQLIVEFQQSSMKMSLTRASKVFPYIRNEIDAGRISITHPLSCLPKIPVMTIRDLLIFELRQKCKEHDDPVTLEDLSEWEDDDLYHSIIIDHRCFKITTLKQIFKIAQEKHAMPKNPLTNLPFKPQEIHLISSEIQKYNKKHPEVEINNKLDKSKVKLKFKQFHKTIHGKSFEFMECTITIRENTTNSAIHALTFPGFIEPNISRSTDITSGSVVEILSNLWEAEKLLTVNFPTHLIKDVRIHRDYTKMKPEDWISANGTPKLSVFNQLVFHLRSLQ